MLSLLERGRFFSGIDSHVFLPMTTAFCLLVSLVCLVNFANNAMSFLCSTKIKHNEKLSTKSSTTSKMSFYFNRQGIVP
jgi:hypothetical protein